MKRLLVCSISIVWSFAAPARAGEVTLANGDRLTGSLVKQDDQLVLQHPDLGTLRIDESRVRSYVLDAGKGGRSAPSNSPPCTVLTRKEVCAIPDAPPAGGKGGATRPWSLSFTLGLSDENGNTDKFAYNIDVEGEYRWRRNRLRARFRSSYEEDSSRQTEGKYHGLVEYSRRVSARGRAWGRWQLDRDDFADLILRTGMFAGYGHDVVRTERTRFGAGAGVGYVIEERSSIPRLETASFLALLDFEHEFRHGDTFRAAYWIAPYVEETQRSPMRLELRYTHPLRAHFDATASFILDYVPDPPEPGIEPYDTALVLGLRWRP